MIDISWLSQGLPLFGVAFVFILVYAILAKTKILGGIKWVDFLISLIMSLIFVSFSGVREYLTNVTPWFTVLISLLFFFLLIVAFAVKDIEKFTKPIGIIFIILLALIAVIAAFYTFPSSQALLPGTLSSCAVSSHYDYFSRSDCYKTSSRWKCCQNSNRGEYELYDSCIKTNSGYKCYDASSSSRCAGKSDIFSKIADWFYQEKIQSAFWLLVIVIIVGIVITRK